MTFNFSKFAEIVKLTIHKSQNPNHIHVNVKKYIQGAFICNSINMHV